MKCPHCDKDIDDTLIAKHLAGKGGKKTADTHGKEYMRMIAKKGGKVKKSTNP